VKRRFLLEWLGLTLATAFVVPVALFLAMVIRMEFVGDKPAEGADIASVELLQGVVQFTTYFACVGLFSFVAVHILKRK